MYDDDQLVLVEARDGGFEEPKIYISAVRPRRADEFQNPYASDYVPGRTNQMTSAVVVGTAHGLLSTPL